MLKKIFAVIALLPLLGMGQGQFTVPTWSQNPQVSHGTEYLRPTADTNSTLAALKTAACNYTATNVTSASNSAVYTGKSGAGPTGASATQAVSTTTSTSYYSMRIFSTWQTTIKSYTALTVNISSMCAITDSGGENGGHCGAAYSTNGGTAWTSLYSYTNGDTGSDSQATHTATITGTALSNVQVGVCVFAFGVASTTQSATITTYDIWTAGTY